MRDEFRRDLYASIQLAMTHAPDRLHPRRGGARRLRRDVDDHRGRSGRRARDACPDRAARADVRASTTRKFVSASRRRQAVGGVHAVRAAHGRHDRAARPARRARTSCSTASSAISGRRPGISGPRWCGAIRRRPSSSATCRTPGSARDFIRSRPRHVRLRARERLARS